MNVRIKCCVVRMYIEGTFRLNGETNINCFTLLQENGRVKVSVQFVLNDEIQASANLLC